MTDTLSTPPTPQPDESVTPARTLSPALLVMAVVPLIGLFLAVGMLIADSSAKSIPAGTSVPSVVGSVGQVMPEFELTNLDGQQVNLTDYRGRPIFLNFWGTWCPPCVKELPEMQAFATSQGDTGAVIIASNNSESPETIRSYFAENGLVVDEILFVQDPDSIMYRWFGVWQMPTTYLVDATGLVRAVKYGAFENNAQFQGYLDEMEAQDNKNGA